MLILKRIFRFIGLSIGLLIPAHVSALSPLGVGGWSTPKLEFEKPPHWLGDDPVLGRMLCPPVTRFNLYKKSNESLFFDEIKEFSRNGQWVCKLTPKKGIYWWSGQPVESKDWSSFISTNLSEVIKEKSIGRWRSESFEVTLEGRDILISWKSKPVFGPYIFNGISFWRKTLEKRGGFQYECSGIYRPKTLTQTSLQLEATPGYKGNHRPMVFYFDSSEQKILENEFINFTWPESQSVDLSIRPPHKAASCDSLINTGWMSLIWWKNKWVTASKDLRIAMTEMIPRGTFLRSGSGRWGELLSSLIPRWHPSYNKRLLVRPFDVNKAKKTMESTEYVYNNRLQKFIHKKTGSVLTLKLANISGLKSAGIVDKVLVDSLQVAGVELMYTQNPADADGVITGFFNSVPQSDFSKYFLPSQNRDNRVLTDFESTELAVSLKEHALSMTLQKPDLAHLTKLHGILYDLEPATVILEHQACVKTSFKRQKTRINQIDPDWFRHLVL